MSLNKQCLNCYQNFRGRRDAKTCSSKCRKQLQRSKIKSAYTEDGSVWYYILTLVIILGLVASQFMLSEHLHRDLKNQSAQTVSLQAHNDLLTRSNQLQLQIQSLSAQVKTQVGAKGDKGDPGPRGPAGANGAKGDKGDPGSSISISSIPDTVLSSNVTLQGNSFNGIQQLVKTDISGALPSLSAGNLTNINPTNLSTGSGAVNLIAQGVNTLSVDTTGSGPIRIGTGSVSKNIDIGNTTGSTSINIASGSGGLSLANGGVSNTVYIGNSGGIATQTIQIGTNSTGGSNTTINIGGSGSGVNSSINLNAATMVTDSLFVNSGGVNPTVFMVNGLNGTVMQEDSTNTFNLIQSPSFEGASFASGWFNLGGSGWSTGVGAYSGNSSAYISPPTYGLKASVAVSSFTTYTFSLYIKSASSNFSTIEVGHSDNGSTTTNCLTAQAVAASSWTRLSCTFTTGSVSGLPYVYFDDASRSHSYYVDAVQLEAAAAASPFHLGSLAINSLINSPLALQPQYATVTAFQILNTSNITLFGIDTLNSRIFSNLPDGPSSVGFTLSTSPYSIAGSKLLSVQNGGSEKFSIDKDGNTTLGSGAVLSFSGSGNTTGALTKWFTCTAATSAGDVVVIDTGTPGNVTTTTTANNPLVAGVVKTGSTAGGSCEVAIAGVVPVNVTKAAAVAIGDRLTTSTTLGQGNTNNAPAVSTVFGKALSAKAAGVLSTVWVLLSLQ